MSELDHLSYSSISSYLSCPAAWEFKYVKKAPTFATPELIFGTAFHETVQGYLQGQGELLSIWPGRFEKACQESRTPIVWGADTSEQYHNEGIRMLGHAAITEGIESIKAQYKQGPIEREVKLSVPGVPVPIIGYIDVMLEGGTPGDFKTSSRAWTADRAQSETQTLFYLAALNQVGETAPGWTFKHFIFVKTKTPQFQVFEHKHNPGEVFWLFGMIRKVWEGIQAEIFPENPGSWRCSPAYCDFWSKCRGRYAK